MNDLWKWKIVTSASVCGESGKTIGKLYRDMGFFFGYVFFFKVSIVIFLVEWIYFMSLVCEACDVGDGYEMWRKQVVDDTGLVGEQYLPQFWNNCHQQYPWYPKEGI